MTPKTPKFEPRSTLTYHDRVDAYVVMEIRGRGVGPNGNEANAAAVKNGVEVLLSLPEVRAAVEAEREARRSEFKFVLDVGISKAIEAEREENATIAQECLDNGCPEHIVKLIRARGRGQEGA